MEVLCGICPWIYFAALPILLTQIWLLSIFRVFDYEDCAYIFILGLIEQSISILYKCIGFYKSFDSKMDLLFQLTKALSNG